MKFLGFEITRTKAQPIGMSPAWQPGWFPLVVHEPFTGAWQRNMETYQTLLTSHYAVFACITLIASDIAKLRVKFIREEQSGVWIEGKSAAYDPVLRRPNKMQNAIQFWENWIISKLIRGNTYVLKGRDNRRVVDTLYVLDPNRVKPLVADNGDVFYELQQDNVSGVPDSRVAVPSSEIIHDRMNCLFHPLCGISPLYAAGLAAAQGLSIQRDSMRFFDNRSIPGGVLSAPGRVTEPTVKFLREQWEQNFGGENRGKIAVLGEGLKFEAMAVTAHDAQLLEQAKATAEWVCTAFRVPPYKIGVGPTPAYNNIQALNLEYYSQCLQILIEAAETCLDQGLEMGPTVGVEFDLDGLLRMDTASQITSLKEAMQAGLLAPNEGRKRLGYAPVDGGDSPLVQQQYFTLEALAEREAAPPPPPIPAPPPEAEEPPQEESNDEDEQQRSVAVSAREVLKRARVLRSIAA